MTTISRTHIEIAAKIYEAHKALKGLWGDEFSKKIQPHVEAFRECVLKGADPLKLLLSAMEAAQKEYDGMSQLVLVAAYVELTEGGES